jgi:hypothetical protein
MLSGRFERERRAAIKAMPPDKIDEHPAFFAE